MNDLIAGIGIALVLEGLLWALLPDAARRMVFEMANMARGKLQSIAWIVVAVGCILVWLARG